MTDPATLCASIHAAGVPGVLACTGGGASAASILLSVPGASRSVLEAVVPYAQDSLTAFLGRPPASFCSEPTALAMAERAFARARRLAPAAPVWGVGCTASLASDRPKRGDHRLYVGVQTLLEQTSFTLTFHKGARDRAGEEAVAAGVVLNAVAEAAGVADRLDLPLLEGEEVVRGSAAVPGPLAAFLRNDPGVPAVCVEPDGRCRTGPPPAALLSGSFNPLHEGHCRLADAASARLGVPVAFELSVTNADKDPIPPHEALRRLTAFAWRAPVWLTRAPTFLDKARLFPGAALVVGADTASRLVACRYYGHSDEQRDAALGEVRRLGCRFLVAGRVDAGGAFVGLEGCGIPPAWADLFTGLSEAEFRLDLSSTQLRQQGQARGAT